MPARLIRVPRLLRLSRGLGQSSGVQAIASEITTIEGTCPSPSNCMNNNPGNLVYAGQPGAIAGPNGFAVFDTYQDGLTALDNQIGLYANGTCGKCNGQPLTFAQMFAIYAPAGQGSNNPTLYAQEVASSVGANPNDLVSSVTSGDAIATTTPILAGTSPDLSTLFSSPVDFSSLGIDFSDPTTLVLLGVVLVAGVMVIGNALR